MAGYGTLYTTLCDIGLLIALQSPRGQCWCADTVLGNTCPAHSAVSCCDPSRT
ncbi:hypothetical protein PAXRUDRAFT_822150 [Paxillus rubicundulus Ve08.2h10]|uniref:Uncharacterized protein n=1 Tax=Paxillus rubicundulus Ve08.2h10 TaxID=930991 RepID=A0A0D0ECU3_9AGAM|nr:hypothetical protein PAXRUDRAFT_822150 [Paxillus rubicundulus Ve08.2h10]